MSAFLLKIPGFESGKFACTRCGRMMHFYFNGGELDQHECCGLTYRTQMTGVELVVYDAESDDD